MNLFLPIHEWERVKSLLTVGTIVEGKIEVFYPQGTLIEIDRYKVIGVTVNIKNELDNEDIYIRDLIRATVSSYDEVNMWIVLEDAQLISRD
ncbi:hypothetical protein [Paenibacillus planticolens]|uniref:S1 motif domain-containing protein n=1 Tax=Paenibacillus planticolens TaxID=2654976 RepID=A0ABX1ZRZ4_9BACL|nr:hypothetical protein [Paenibacillus planticolens]NOV01395.1 hypothetical protein [Paenibacillus planticolens]